MGREIKFRAWNKDEKMMVDLQKITPLALDDMMNTQLSMKGGSGLFIPFLKEIILMQYTGLKDKNGKEIYEEDIAKDEDGEVSVYYENGCYYVQNINYKEGFLLGDCNETIEIIGNKYENPELIS